MAGGLSIREAEPAIERDRDALALTLEGLDVVEHPRWKNDELSGFERNAGDLITVRQLHFESAGVHVHRIGNHRIDETQETAVLLAWIMLAGLDTVDAAP